MRLCGARCARRSGRGASEEDEAGRAVALSRVGLEELQHELVGAVAAAGEGVADLHGQVEVSEGESVWYAEGAGCRPRPSQRGPARLPPRPSPGGSRRHDPARRHDPPSADPRDRPVDRGGDSAAGAVSFPGQDHPPDLRRGHDAHPVGCGPGRVFPVAGEVGSPAPQHPQRSASSCWMARAVGSSARDLYRKARLGPGCASRRPARRPGEPSGHSTDSETRGRRTKRPPLRDGDGCVAIRGTDQWSWELSI